MADVTIYTIAKELNMSPSMVSRAFNPDGRINAEKRRLVLETAKKYNFSPNRMASRLSGRTVRIGILINSRFKINTIKMIEGINAAYEMFKDYKVDYDITVRDPACTELCEYREILEGYSRYDGIIVSGMSSAEYTDMLNDLYEKNSNVVQVQAINEGARCLLASKHNEKTAAETAAEFLYNCLKKSERKNVLLFIGDKASTLHVSAEKAFENACASFGLELTESIEMKDSEEYFETILPSVFAEHIDLTDGIYITSGASESLCRCLAESGKDVFFVAFDTHESIKQYLEKGIVSAAVNQNVKKQMQNAFELLAKYIINGTACPCTVYTDIQLVLKSNMYQFD